MLLDDVLAALDVHTYVFALFWFIRRGLYVSPSSKHIVRECLQGELLRGRTVLLVVSFFLLWLWSIHRLFLRAKIVCAFRVDRPTT